MVIKMLKKYNGSITDAAKELGITRQALYRRIEKYGI
jgi:two-component system, NtrC family, response regulator HydG